MPLNKTFSSSIFSTKNSLSTDMSVNRDNRTITSSIMRVSNSSELIQFKNKTAPYFSEKRNVEVNINGVAKDIYGRQIVCRHLASYWEMNFMETNGKVNYQLLSTPDAIAKNVCLEKTEDFSKSPAYIYFVENKKWGTVITNFFYNMKKNGDFVRTLSACTLNHQMALGLKIKRVQESEKWVVQFFDPNRTVTHKRTVFTCDSHFELSQLSAKDFFDDFYWKIYGLEQPGQVIFEDRHNSPLTNTVKLLPDELINSRVIYHAITKNLTEVLFILMEKYKNGEISQSKLVNLLATRSSDGTPAFYIALQNGYSDIIQVYGKILNMCNLSQETILTLLAAVGANNVSGLCMSFMNGHVDTIKAYGEIVFKTPLTSDKRLYLLAAKDSHDLPGLFFALQNGHADSIRMFGSLLNKKMLSSEQIKELLKVKHGLFMALQNGHTKAIMAYGDILKILPPHQEYIDELLWIKNPNGTSGLFMAFYNGHTETIRAFCNILKNYSFTTRRLVEMLSATNKDGIPGVFVSVVNRDKETILEYCRIIKENNLEPDTIAEQFSKKMKKTFIEIINR
ncbi:TPA: ShET2/EspL2 family type III secretion system effector toxin, partial [Shigella flexneri]